MPRHFWCFSFLCLLVLAIALSFARPLVAATLTVTDFGDSGAPGQLRSLLNAASPGDTIVIPPGTIRLTVQAGGGLRIARDMTLQGAGAGLTIIDGGDVSVAGSIGVIFTISEAAVTISGVSIRNAKFFFEAATFGGGILNSGTLTVRDVSISDNGGDQGGGIANTGTATLINVTVNGNDSGVFGPAGGIENTGTMTLTNVTVSGNGGAVGGIHNRGTMTLSNVSVNGNGTGIVGGIANSGTMILTDVAVSGNQGGSGIRNFGILTITNSAIDQNGFFASGIENHGTLTLTASTISGHMAFQGGGLFNDGTATLTNSTISENTAVGGEGSGIWNSGTLTVINSTISGNLPTGIARTPADGILNLPGGSATFSNAIMANGASRNCSGLLVSLGHNLDTGSTCGFIGPGDLSNTDPLLGPLRANGGPTPTHALLPGSPAIDAGDNTGCPPTDQRGVPRPQGAVCDIGAYEATGVSPETAAANFVTRLYEVVLGRAPEPGAVPSWVQQIHQDSSLVPTVLAFFHSPEFLGRHTTDSQFLTILYHTFLNRDPDDAGFTGFLSALQAGQLTRDNLLDVFLDSPEFAAQASFLQPPDPVTAFVTALYVRILGRGPDQAGLQSFVAQLRESRTVLPTVQLFLASPEFLTRNTTNTEFVTLLYRVFLNRLPDPDGLATWVGQLTQGTTTRAQLLLQFAASPEFQPIEAGLFPLPRLAAVYDVTGTVRFTDCQAGANNGTFPLAGTMVWSQAGASIQADLDIPFSQRQLFGIFEGSITASGQLTGTLVAFDITGSVELELRAAFSGSLADNTFSLQFSGRLSRAESCNLSGSLAGTRQPY